jgi:hypothetical protein
VERYGLLTNTFVIITDDPVGEINADCLSDWRRFLGELTEVLELARKVDDTWRENRSSSRRDAAATALDSELEDLEANLVSTLNSKLALAFAGHLDRIREPGAQPRRELSVRPLTMAAFIWLELAATLASGKRIHRCLMCKKWMVSTPIGTRDIKVVCSGTCRTRLWIRKRKAGELHAAGKTEAQIARELGADIESVKTWVPADKERTGRLIDFDEK